MAIYDDLKLGYDKVCCVCGETFFLPSYMRPNYTYRVRIGDNYYKYCCSYTCYSKKIDEQNRKRRGV